MLTQIEDKVLELSVTVKLTELVPISKQLNVVCPEKEVVLQLSIIPSGFKNIATQISTGVLRISNCDQERKSDRQIRLQPTLATLKEGDRLRISISGSGWPAIGINPGQSQYSCEGPSPHCLVTTITLLLSNSKLKFESLISP